MCPSANIQLMAQLTALGKPDPVLWLRPRDFPLPAALWVFVGGCQGGGGHILFSHGVMLQRCQLAGRDPQEHR